VQTCANPQVEQKEAAVQGLGAQLAALQADFDYNLALLEGRDRELQQCEQALAGAGAELAAKLDLITQMQQALAEAEQGKLLRWAPTG
jgi:prefoldin subunit 5